MRIADGFFDGLAEEEDLVLWEHGDVLGVCVDEAVVEVDEDDALERHLLHEGKVRSDRSDDEGHGGLAVVKQVFGYNRNKYILKYAKKNIGNDSKEL